MQMQLEDFARAIREGGRPQTGLEEALVVQKISDAIYAMVPSTSRHSSSTRTTTPSLPTSAGAAEA
jgi:predicted dehydrogenase